ncbi:unnamed protein product [Caenorhabditis auriculariae]|uniref:F-box domain-containing protein n=1 Tax=Caenorhabditis auriculariae TaxID=2777116 RepID=A0A8S1H9H7_9PELO|nr:unnamed protein product [Caenorhabditis auriculariae]
MRSLLELPPHIILKILQESSVENFPSIRLTCSLLDNYIVSYRSLLPPIEYYYCELSTSRCKLWQTRSSCTRYPLNDLSSLEMLHFTSFKVFSVIDIDEGLFNAVVDLIKNYGLRFDHLQLHNFNHRQIEIPLESVSNLLLIAKATGILFDVRSSNLTPEMFKLPGLVQCKTMSFEMDDSLVDVTQIHSPRIIVHQCDRISTESIRRLLQDWVSGKSKLECARISSNQNISFEEIFREMPMEHVQASGYVLTNVLGKKAYVTVRRNSYHFFATIEATCNVEDVLYWKPIFE